MDHSDEFRGLTDAFANGRLSRRSFLRASALLGIGGAAAAFLAACSASSTPSIASLAPSGAAASAGAGASAASSAAAGGAKDAIFMRSGTGVVTDHPFYAMVADYNAAHPNVEVKLEMYPWSNDTAPLATTLAAGNPPDVTRQSIPGVSVALQSPLLIDVAPFLKPEEIADYGKDILAPPTINGKVILWPQDRDWGTMLAANGTMLQAAGIDVKGIHTNGWTFDEFRAAVKKLTNGDTTYGLAFSNDYASEMQLELGWRAGVPDGNANMGAYLWGNKFDLTGPAAIKTAQLIHDMIYVDKSIPSEVTGLKEHQTLLYSGKAAMIPYWHGIIGELAAYNNAIDAGKVTGTKANFDVALLPWPYDAANGGANVNIARTTGLALFKQNPYKGDEHTANVAEFVRYLTSPVNLAVFANWEGTIPAKNSAYPYATQLSNPSNCVVGPVRQGTLDCDVPIRPPGLWPSLVRWHECRIHGHAEQRATP